MQNHDGILSAQQSTAMGRFWSTCYVDYREEIRLESVDTQRGIERSQQLFLIDTVHPTGLPNRDLACKRTPQKRVLERTKTEQCKHLEQLWRRISNEPGSIFSIDRDWPGRLCADTLVCR